jgi:hypothetical protein
MIAVLDAQAVTAAGLVNEVVMRSGMRSRGR